MFKFAVGSGMIERPVVFGITFTKPSASVLRGARSNNGKRLFTAAEVLRLLAAASPQMRAMILLGVNAGYGNHDVAALPIEALDLDTGAIAFDRPKTHIARRCILWPETVEALKVVLADRPAKGLVFVTKYGVPWVRTQGEKQTPIDAVCGSSASYCGDSS